MTIDDPAISALLQPQTRYARKLAERRETARIEQLANFGLALGWVCLLVGGFCWFCVVTRWDTLWLSMFLTGFALLPLATIIPEILEVPCRLWMRLAQWQGWIVMSLLLTIIYFALIAPAGWILRSRKGTHPFHSWNAGNVPENLIGWEPVAVRQITARASSTRRRSLPMLLLSTLGFFYERGHYLVLPILVLLMAIGAILFFVQGSVLAPFIYTIF